jgi:hypothetical protein
MSSYAVVQPPFTLKFREMSKSELQAYRAWFHDIEPTRIAELTRAVKSTHGFETWEPDETPNSLDRLSEWCDAHVETRKRTPEEVADIRSSLVFPIDVPEEGLTNRSFSLAMDLGMYFARVILKNLPGTRWDQPLRNKKFVDYGQPVIMGFGSVPLNPVRVLVMTAYGVSRKQPARLGDLYRVWAKKRKS